MIVRRLEELLGTERDVDWGNGKSRRLLLESDGMGFALTDTVVEAGTESLLHYKNHLEACYCISGRGEIEHAGVKYELVPGTVYALDGHEEHFLRATETMRLVCVFNPPLKGPEKHDLSKGHGSHY